MERFKTCFENVSTEDLKKYINLAQEEVKKRELEAASEAWNKMVEAIKDFLSIPGTMLSIDEKFSVARKERLQFDFDKETSIGYISEAEY